MTTEIRMKRFDATGSFSDEVEVTFGSSSSIYRDGTEDSFYSNGHTSKEKEYLEMIIQQAQTRLTELSH